MKHIYVSKNGYKYTIGADKKKKVFHVCVAAPGMVTKYYPHPVLPYMYDRELAAEMLLAYAARKGLRQVVSDV